MRNSKTLQQSGLHTSHTKSGHVKHWHNPWIWNLVNLIKKVVDKELNELHITIPQFKLTSRIANAFLWEDYDYDNENLHLCSRFLFLSVWYMKWLLNRDLQIWWSDCALALQRGAAASLFRRRTNTWTKTRLQLATATFTLNYSYSHFAIFYPAWRKIRGKGNWRNRTSKRWSWKSERNYNLLRMRLTPRSNRGLFSSQTSFRNSTVNQPIKGIKPWR